MTEEMQTDTKKWEYLILNANEHDFNGLGMIGYELVSVDQGKAYFKRSLMASAFYKKLAKEIANEILDTPLDRIRIK